MADPTVDWGTRVVSVPQSFLTFIGGVSYQLDTNAFRVAINGIEASELGIVHPQIIVHKTTSTLDGIQYARIIEIVNGYTITFEETGSPYKVFLNGSNNNILTVTNLGTVQVAPNNSAGLINLLELQQIVFGGEVHVDQNNTTGKATEGTLYPASSPLAPSLKFSDAVVVANSRGFGDIHVIGNATLGAGDNVDNFIIHGDNAARTSMTINPASGTLGLEIRECSVTGTLDGVTIIRKCSITDLGYFNGYLFQSEINGKITLGAGAQAAILNCYSGKAGTLTPELDMGGSGQSLSMRDYYGGILITNKTGPEAASIDLSSGQVKIDLTTVTNGTIVVRGVGKVINNANGDWLPSGTYGGLTLVNETVWGIQLQELWTLAGLDPDVPVTSTKTSRSAGAGISILVTGDGVNTSTHTRV